MFKRAIESVIMLFIKIDIKRRLFVIIDIVNIVFKFNL